MLEFPQEKFDNVILGNVLCEVPNQSQILSQIYDILKVGGQVIFIEHVAHPPNTPVRIFQNIMNPVYTILSDGCNLNRDTLEQIQQAPWSELIHWEIKSGGPLVLNRVHIGIACK
eukprot:TRINITY_DN1876_c0_g1_i1.p2 TRINITY_DN1876_c0_g1~~TRINITY_DN1876_c0_g1_i1.p2  ORF type:complete len:115 (-),score=19.01 TRINITY_DN1876_c0_g1_i1:28-372(-)